jgi:hypothetical protein
MSTITAALAALAEAECRVLVIGGNALEAHGYARFTIDVDCLITASSIDKLKAALSRHGFQHAGRMNSFHEFWFEGKPGGMPIHAMFVNDETFEKMWARREAMPSATGPLHVPCVVHLIALKLHAAKNNPKRLEKDMGDVLELLERNPDAVTREELEQVCKGYASPESISVLKEHHHL